MKPSTIQTIEAKYQPNLNLIRWRLLVRTILGILTTLIAVIGLTSCNLPRETPTSGGQTGLATNRPKEQPETLVSFNVRPPDNTPADEPVLLSVLDEVTGLALNARRYEMEPKEDGQYTLSIPLPVGTILKYRYSRQGNLVGEEHTSDGSQVRYRLYQVQPSGEVQDTITRWNDTLYAGPTGRLTGFAINAEDGKPIPGLLVAIGGAQTYTRADGSFMVEGLPPGIHNLVVYAIDGFYQTFQQGAKIAAQSTTSASIQLNPTKFVDITFLVRVPPGTVPGVPIRLVGNLYQLGNTFANLSGGTNTLTSRMPVLSPLPDGRHGVIISLPVGADIRYKYTLGDGFWNSERLESGEFSIRKLIVPDTPTTIEDQIITWSAGDRSPITFDVSVPENTPDTENISIQFNPYGWTEPLPMWVLQDNRWAYVLFSPLDFVNQIGFRYCRAEQCGQADDLRTPGEFTSGQIVKPNQQPQIIQDQVESWIWLEPDIQPASVPNLDIQQRSEEFLAGVELQSFYQPSFGPRLPLTFTDIRSMNANWVILTPSWSFTSLDPPVLEIVPSQNPIWIELVNAVRQAIDRNLNVGIKPVPKFPTSVDEWWANAPRDFPWWVSWFDRTRAFFLHHADLADRTDVNTIILGGDWLEPALPGGTLADGSPSGVPADAEERWSKLLEELGEHFSGDIAWAIPYPNQGEVNYDFIDSADQIYLMWSAPLASEHNPSFSDVQTEALRLLEEEIHPIWEGTGEKPLILSVTYPSADGGITGCLPDPILECISPNDLNYPAPDYPTIDLDMGEQALAYNALLAAMHDLPWIKGFISRGYYPPVIMHDKSISVHGKPAAGVLEYWFSELVGESQP